MRYFARNLIINYLSGFQHGKLILKDPIDTLIFGSVTAQYSQTATINLSDLTFYNKLLIAGRLAAIEGYINGHWQTDDLISVLRLFIRNYSLTQKHSILWMPTIFYRLGYPLLYKHITNYRKTITCQHDVSHDLCNLFLDDKMMYSCAIFPKATTTLNHASSINLDKICQKLMLKPTDRLLEIGTGWGGFAIYAATHYGCQIVTTTLSQQQYNIAKQRIKNANLTDKITLVQQDYRQLSGQFDKLVSIELIEMLDYQSYNAFFSTCAALLKPQGYMLFQTTTIPDQVYQKAKHGIDDIRRYLFPLSNSSSIMALQQAMTKSGDLRLYNLEDIGLHYIDTLRHWRNNFLNNQQAVEKLGFDTAFIRLWHYHFCYLEAGFTEGYLSNVQMLLIKSTMPRMP